VKVCKLTESSIARWSGGIKKLASHINDLVQSIKTDPASRRTSLALPEAIDISRLYDLNANYGMWTAETGHVGNQFTEPYMVDEDVRQGIAALLAHERATEEIHRLIEELHIMIRWISLRLQKISVATGICSGNHPINQLLIHY
jgi:hypothetical protein